MIKRMKWLAAGIGLLSAGVCVASESPTFHKDVAPILQRQCASCHQPGEVAPFALLTYADAKKRMNSIADVVGDRLMPPWKAVPGHGEFFGERRLTDEQVATIQKWAKAGGPEGDPKDAPPALKVAGDGWRLGEPDLVVTMPESYTVPAEGRDLFRCFVIPLNLPEDKYVRAVEFRPGNKKVVHHALFFLDTTGAARKLDEADPGIGYGRMGGVGFTPTGSLGGWAPGAFVQPLPQEYARTIKKGSDLVIQTHFHPTGKPETEKSTIAIYYQKGTPSKIIRSFPIGERKIDIPAGEKNHVIKKQVTTPIPVEVVGITPHAHLLCKSMKVWATLPDGSTQWLVRVDDWDFNWQDQYIYKTPLKLPAGTRIDMEFAYDNSASNPRNPANPPKRVRYGEQTNDEMAFAFLQIVPEGLGTLLGGRRGEGGGGGAGELTEEQKQAARDILRRLRERQQ